MAALPTPPVFSRNLGGDSGITVARQAQPAAELPEWAIAEHKISVVLRGGYRLEQVFGGRHRVRLQTRAGDVTIMPAQSVIAYQWDARIDVVDIFIPVAALSDAAAKRGRQVELLERFADRHPPLARMARLLSEEAGRPDADDLILDGLAHALFSVLLRDGCGVLSSRQRRSLGPAILRRAKDMMAGRTCDPPTVGEVAAVVGLSATHFAMAFTAETGMPPGAFMRRLQIERAKAMLAQTDLDLSTVACRTGFSSHSQFSRAFAKSVGVPPSRYRRSLLR